MGTQLVEIKPKILVTRFNGVSFDRAFLATEQGARILSNKELDKILVESDVWKSVKDVFAAWSGTMTAYAEPEKKLGSTIEYQDPRSKINWIFPVPAGCKGLKNAILVAEHPDYNLVKEKENRIVVNVPKDKIIVVENIPTEEGSYAYDEKTRVPINQKMECSENNSHRHFYRTLKRVGPVARGYNYLRYYCKDGSDYYACRSYVDRRYVGVGDIHQPSDRLGVLVATEAAAPSTVREGKLQLAEKIARDAKPKLQEFSKVVKSESLEESAELIKLLTEQ
jgi:hypothetical protein